MKAQAIEGNLHLRLEPERRDAREHLRDKKAAVRVDLEHEHAVRMHRRYDVEELRLQQGFAAEPHHAHAAHAIARKLVFHEGHHVCE